MTGRMRIALAVLALAIALASVAPSIAETTSTEPVPEVKVAASAAGREAVKSAQRALVLFSGMNPLRCRAMEDAVALELLNAGVEVVSRSRAETLMAQKLLEAVPQTQSTAGENQPNPPETATEPEARPKLEPVGAIQVAKAAGARIALLGTVLEERQRSGAGKPGFLLEQPAVVVTVTVQVVDVETDTLLMVLAGEWPNGTTILEAARELARALAP